MNVYNVITLIQNMDNMDSLDTIFQERCFNTSVMTPEIYAEIKEQAINIFKLGEKKVYEFVKDAYGLKM